MQDGSFLGTMLNDDGSSQLMVSFDSSGNLKWSMPGNYQPQIATADGGLIATTYSGQAVTFDANGNSTGQMVSLPTYSWKGAYQLGSVHSVIPTFDPADIATTFASVPGGNLTGNGFSMVHHTFGLVFCSNDQGADASSCPNNTTNMSFSYLAGLLSNYNGACDFSNSSPCDANTAHPEWVNTIKIQALNAYEAAFANLPAIVRGKYSQTMLYGGTSTVNHFERTIYIDGSWLGPAQGCPPTGKTTGTSWSWVFYLSTMCGAQVALGPYGNSPDFSPPFSDAGNFQKLATAIGKGIGTAAAHETGHQLSFTDTYKFSVINMDCNTDNQPCEDNVDSVYEFYKSDESSSEVL